MGHASHLLRPPHKSLLSDPLHMRQDSCSVGMKGLSQGGLGFASLTVRSQACPGSLPETGTLYTARGPASLGFLPKEPGHLRCLPAFLSGLLCPSQGRVEPLPHLHLSLEASDLPPWWLCLPTSAYRKAACEAGGVRPSGPRALRSCVSHRP